MTKQLVFRTDADAQTGTGHLMRCLALSQNWLGRGREVTFITYCESETLRKRLSSEGIQVIMLEKSHPNPTDWEITSRVLREYSDAWVVLDGYHFDSKYQNRVKNTGHRLMVIDDTAHLSQYYADILLNQNLFAEKLEYCFGTATRTLFGTRYVLLRPEFLVWRGWKRAIPDMAHKILVTLGGSDPNNATLKIIEAIKAANIFDLEVKIVVGASNLHIYNLKDAVSSAQCKMIILHNVANMAELMSWADLAVAAGGTTCWEMAFMKLPFISVVLANNQIKISSAIEEAGIAVSCGWHNQINILSLAKRLSLLIQDKSGRQMMSIKGAELVDYASDQCGEGA